MERGFYNEDIEQLLKQKADQYRMYPSDKVWKGINRSLHPRRKWYWFSFILFLTAIGYYAFVELIATSGNKPVSTTNPSSAISKPTDASGVKAVIIPFGNPHKQGSIPAGSNNKQSAFIYNP